MDKRFNANRLLRVSDHLFLPFTHLWPSIFTEMGMYTLRPIFFVPSANDETSCCFSFFQLLSTFTNRSWQSVIDFQLQHASWEWHQKHLFSVNYHVLFNSFFLFIVFTKLLFFRLLKKINIDTNCRAFWSKRLIFN